MKKRILALLCLVSQLLAACGESKEPISGNIEVTTETAAETQSDNIPEGTDLGGVTIRVYTRGDTNDTEFDAEATGDIVDDAIYNRNRTIEERLNVTLEYFSNTTEDFWGDRNIYMDTVRSSVMANDGSIDIAAGLSLMMPFLAEEGLFYNLLAEDVPYLDLTYPWWSESMINELAVHDRLYFASGEASLGVIKGMMCFYFNKSLISDLQLEDPYELVTNGSWTLDKFGEMAAQAYNDINGDSTIDPSDRFGFIIANENHASNFLNSSELRVTRMNEAGIPEMALGEEKVVDLVSKLSTIMTDPGSAVVFDGKTEYSTVFDEGRALFSTGEFSNAANFRDMTFDFGVIPFPKYDENQTEYYTTARSTYSCFGIPITADMTNCAAVLEAMASESYYQVTPAYYEKALKVKYSRDDISSQMFDLIRDGVVYDFGTVFSQVLSTADGTGINVKFRQTVCRAQDDWATEWAQYESAVTENLNICIETLNSLEQ